MIQFLLDKLQACTFYLRQNTLISQKRVFSIHDDRVADKLLPGSKASILCEMARLSFPIPPGFVITTNTNIDEPLLTECKHAIKELERNTGKFFGANGTEQRESSQITSLLLCVRSGEENIKLLNLGMNDAVVQNISMCRGDKRFGLDLYRHFLALFGVIVLKKKPCLYEDALDQIMNSSDPPLLSDEDLTIKNLEALVKQYKTIANFDERSGTIVETTIPDDPFLQIVNARRFPTAEHVIIVDTMVFGNMNGNSGCGTVFSRDPETGENCFTGEYFRKAQGKVTVSPPPTPLLSLHHLEADHSHAYHQLAHFAKQLEQQFNEVQKVTFTIEDGVLFVLQAQPAPRSPKAAARIAVEMVREGSTSKSEAILKLNPNVMSYFLHPMVDPDKDVSASLLGHGKTFSVGAVSGRAVFSPEKAIECAQDSCILITKDLTLNGDDLLAEGVDAAAGVLVMCGVDQAFDETYTLLWNDKCVITEVQYCSSLFLGLTDTKAKSPRNSSVKLCKEGNEDKILHCKKNKYDCVRDSTGLVRIKQDQYITLDGATGRILMGEVNQMEPAIDRDFTTLLQWTNQFRRMDVLGSCDSTLDVQESVKFGTEGIGLLQIEHLLQVTSEGCDAVANLLSSNNTEESSLYLSKIKDMLVSELNQIFDLLSTKPVTILLFDLQRKKENMSTNVAHVYAEFVSIQVSAIIETTKQYSQVLPRIMIPSIASEREIWKMAELIHTTADPILNSLTSATQQPNKVDSSLHYEVGAVLATPRSCLRARHITAQAATTRSNLQFLTFDTDELTKLVWGFQRDTTDSMMQSTPQKTANPLLETIDQQGVGELLSMAKRMIRIENPAITVGVIGNHTADHTSVKFFDRIGIDNISCPGNAIPGAKVAAAQAYIQHLWCSHVTSEDQYAHMPCDVTDMLAESGSK